MPIHDPWEVVWPLSIQEWRSETPTNMYTRTSELKTLEWETLNSDRLIWISTVETFNFLFNLLLLDITFPTTCYKDTFDNNYRYNAISIGLISDWTMKSAVQKPAFRTFKQIFNNKLIIFFFNLSLSWNLRLGLNSLDSDLELSFFYLFLC